MRRINAGIQGNQLRSDRPLTVEQMYNVAPAIFATAAHPDRSERFSPIATFDVIKALSLEGFEPFMVAQTNSRDDLKRGYARHMVRLRHQNESSAEGSPEIILGNALDGTGAYSITNGYFRMVCQNGLVTGDVLSTFKIPHTGKVTERVVESCYSVLENFHKADDLMEEMKGTELAHQEMLVFAESALKARYGDDEPPVDPVKILKPRRREDLRGDLWTTFNVVQENLIRGGASQRDKDCKKKSVRAITSVDRDVKLNQALWVLAEGMLQIKNGTMSESQMRQYVAA